MWGGETLPNSGEPETRFLRPLVATIEGRTMETLFALVLFVMLPTGEVHSFVADNGLTAEDCRDAASVRQVPGAPIAWVCEEAPRD